MTGALLLAAITAAVAVTVTTSDGPIGAVPSGNATASGKVPSDAGLEVPPGWTVSGPASPDATLTLHLALKPARPAEELATMAAQLSDPTHPHFGAYLGLDDLVALVEAEAHCIAVVEDWADSPHGVNSAEARPKTKFTLSPTRDWLLAEMSVKAASRLLGTRIWAVTNDRLGGDRVFLRADPGQLMRAVPRAVARCLDLIGGLSRFPVRGLVAPAIVDAFAGAHVRQLRPHFWSISHAVPSPSSIDPPHAPCDMLYFVPILIGC